MLGGNRGHQKNQFLPKVSQCRNCRTVPKMSHSAENPIPYLKTLPKLFPILSTSLYIDNHSTPYLSQSELTMTRVGSQGYTPTLKSSKSTLSEPCGGRPFSALSSSRTAKPILKHGGSSTPHLICSLSYYCVLIPVQIVLKRCKIVHRRFSVMSPKKRISRYVSLFLSPSLFSASRIFEVF